jgi:hypothetical protein
MNASFGDLPESQTFVLNDLGVNSERGDIELNGASFSDPSYDNTVADWINTLTTHHIVPLPLLNQYIEMSDIDVSAFVGATVGWCKAYCAGGTFYTGNSAANPAYAPQVLEILNEPYGDWWGYPVNSSDIAAYGTLLKAIRTGLDGAGLTNIGILAAANGDGQTWDPALISNGGFAAASAITVHAYGEVDLSQDTPGTNSDGWGLVYYAHQLLVNAGLAAHADIYVTEDGWCTATGGDCVGSGTPFTEAQKDANIATVINQLATVSWLKGFWYFNLHPYGSGSSENSFGLYTCEYCDDAGAETPAWGAFQAAAQANGF